MHFRNLLAQKENLYKAFASAMEKKFMQMRFGVKSCSVEQDLWLAEVRKEIADWQQNHDDDALCQVAIDYYTSLNVDYSGCTTTSDFNQTGTAGSIHSQNGCQTFKINYNYAGGLSNVVDINTAGCITRINLNPVISNDGGRFVFVQQEAAEVWIIQHNLNFTPNVFTEDEEGVDIQGVISIVDANTLHVTFSSAVAGKAYLS